MLKRQRAEDEKVLGSLYLANVTLHRSCTAWKVGSPAPIAVAPVAPASSSSFISSGQLPACCSCSCSASSTPVHSCPLNAEARVPRHGIHAREVPHRRQPPRQQVPDAETRTRLIVVLCNGHQVDLSSSQVPDATILDSSKAPSRCHVPVSRRTSRDAIEDERQRDREIGRHRHVRACLTWTCQYDSSLTGERLKHTRIAPAKWLPTPRLIKRRLPLTPITRNGPILCPFRTSLSLPRSDRLAPSHDATWPSRVGCLSPPASSHRELDEPRHPALSPAF